MTWNTTRLPAPRGSAPSSSRAGGDVYAHGARKSDRKKIAPFNRTRSSTRGTTANGSRTPATGSGLPVMPGGVSVMAQTNPSADSRQRTATTADPRRDHPPRSRTTKETDSHGTVHGYPSHRGRDGAGRCPGARSRPADPGPVRRELPEVLGRRGNGPGLLPGRRPERRRRPGRPPGGPRTGRRHDPPGGRGRLRPAAPAERPRAGALSRLSRTSLNAAAKSSVSSPCQAGSAARRAAPDGEGEGEAMPSPSQSARTPTPPGAESVPRSLRVAAAWSWRFLVIAAAAAVIVTALRVSSLVVVPLAVAALVAALLAPAVQTLTGRTPLRRGAGALVVLLVTGLVVLARCGPAPRRA